MTGARERPLGIGDWVRVNGEEIGPKMLVVDLQGQDEVIVAWRHDKVVTCECNYKREFLYRVNP